MEMKSKQKYTGGRVRKPKPKLMDVTGMRIIKPSDVTKGPHYNFAPGGLYSDKKKEG
jgi:hypothetical protein